MPKRIYKKKRAYKKKGKTAARKPRLYRAVGIPDHMFAKVKFVELRQRSISASSRDVCTWHLNSLYDPNATDATGNQPYYHDQYSALYSKYRVYGCKMVARVSSSCSAAQLYSPIAAFIPHATATVSWATTQAAMMANGAMWKLMLPDQKMANFSRYYPIHKIAGVSKITVRNDDQFGALYNANPANLIYLTLYSDNSDGTSTISYEVEIQLTYYVKYYCRVQPGAS